MQKDRYFVLVLMFAKKTACFFGGGEICLTLRHLTIILTYA